jgi:uncharacterized membrane protein YsdA (DUF1294 family)
MQEKNNLICLFKIDNHIYKNVPPLGVLYLASALSKNGFQVEIYHIENSEIDAYAQMILNKNPLFVGFSVVTGWGGQACSQIFTHHKRQKSNSSYMGKCSSIELAESMP